MNSTPKSTGIQSNMTIKFEGLIYLNHTNNVHQTKSLMTSLPQWVLKTIELVGSNAGNLNIG